MKKESTAKNTLKIYWRFTAPYKVAVVCTLILPTIATVSGNIGIPYLVSRILDYLTQNPLDASVKGNISRLIGFVMILEFVNFTAHRLHGYVFIRQQAATMRDIEQHIFRRLTAHSYTFFANRFGGSLVAQANRFVNSYERLEDLLTFEIVPVLARFTFAVGFLLWQVPVIGFAVLGWAIVFVASVSWMSIKKMPHSKRAAAEDSKVTGALADSITNMNDVKSYARQQYESERYNSISNKRYDLRLRSWLLDEWIRMYMAAVVVCFEVVVLWLSVNAVYNKSASIGIILLVQFYVSKIMFDLWGINQVIRRVEQSLGDSAEMSTVLSLPYDVNDAPQAEEARITRGKIQFNNVTFAYPDSKDKALFKNFSMSIKPGEKVGLVGRSGGGKTTITKLLLRYLDISEGEIVIDGQNIAMVQQESLRSQIATVSQEPALFHRSLIDNIRYGRLDASDEEVRAVAKMANAAVFIEAFEKGYDTLVGERGVKLSGGQRQRISIARAMLKNSPILLLDEATSALDSESEQLIQGALWTLMEGRTAIVIAHRLSTIQKMDRILVLDDGEIVEEGSHKELLQKGGIYADLWGRQSGGFIED